MSESVPMTSAQLRAEARQRRLLQSDQRLARIKAMSQGKELPPLNDPSLSRSLNPAPSPSSNETSASTQTKDPTSNDDDTMNTKSLLPATTKLTNKETSESRQRKHPPPSNTLSTSSQSNPSIGKGKKSSVTSNNTSIPSSGTSAQERMMMAQLQERSYVTSTRRWRIIHLFVMTLLSILLFIYVIWNTAIIHVDGEEILGALLFTSNNKGDLRIPTIGVFNIFMATECVLSAARYFIDKPSTNPPVTDIMQHLTMTAPGMASKASVTKRVSGLAHTLTNASYIFQLLLCDFCHLLLVFGIGIVVCAYCTGLDDIKALVS